MMVYAASISKTVFDEATQKVLSRPEYSILKNPIEDFIQNIKNQIMEWISQLLLKLFLNQNWIPSASQGMSGFVMVLALAVGVLIIVGIFFLLLKATGKKKRPTVILGEEIGVETTPESLRNKAKFYAKEGDLRLALRYDFIALLLKLHEMRLVYLEDTWTNEELFAYLVERNFGSEQALKRLMSGFNAVWYGHKPCGQTDYSHWSVDMDCVWKEADHYEV